MNTDDTGLGISRRWLILLAVLVVIITVWRFYDTFIRSRGYRKPIPNPQHFLVVQKGDFIKFTMRNDLLQDGCFAMYKVAFKGQERSDTLIYDYVFDGAYWPDTNDLVSRYKDDLNACQPGDRFVMNFNLRYPDNHALILKDLYRAEPP